MAIALTGLLLVAIALLNAWATRAILGDYLATPTQRAAQIAFVWFIPILGALFTLHFKRKDDEPSEGGYREIPNPGDDMASSTHGWRAGRDRVGSDSSGPTEGGHGD